MRRLIVGIAAVWGFTIAGAYAAPAYGTRMPEKNRLAAGLQYYTLLHRDLEYDSGTLRSQQEFLLLSYGVTDWLSVDLKGGVGNIRQRPQDADTLRYPTFLGGGYGFRVRAFARGPFKAVCGFQHISIHPYSIDVGPFKHKAVLDDWQFSALGSYSLGRLTPYLGGRWSRADYIHWVDGVRNRVKSTAGKSLGLIAGMDIAVTPRVWLNLEAQAFDSTAFAASVNYAF